MRAEEVARAADTAFAIRLQRLACPSTPAGTCPAMGVYDCDYCHDQYVESHRQSCPSTPRGTCVAIADWEYWNHDYPYCVYCHGDPPRTARREPAAVYAGCDNTETTWRCECTCTCGSPSGHPGLCAVVKNAAPTAAPPPAAGAGLPTWRVLLELDMWGDVWRDVARLAAP